MSRDRTRLSVLVVADDPLGTQICEALGRASASFDAVVVEPDEVSSYEPVYDLALLAAANLDSLPELSPRRPTVVVGCDGPEAAAEAIERGANDALEADELGPRSLSRTIAQLVELDRSRRRLADADRRRDLLLRAANDGLWEWDLDTDEILYSARWCYLVGLEDETVDPSPVTWFNRVHPEDLAALREDIEAHRDGATPIHQFEHRIRRPDGRERWVLSRALVRRDRWGRAVALAGSLTDINARKVAQLNTVDELTGLPSRRVLIERLDHAIAVRGEDQNFRFSVLFLNLDRFKILNDSIGLDSADKILALLAHRLQTSVDTAGLVCRYGGDEFAVLMEGHDDFAAAEALASAIHDSLRQPFELDEQTIFTSASIGITNSARNYDSATEVIRDATIATSRAKRRGTQSSTFDAAMRQEALKTLRTQTQLREAIDRQQFEVYYQPIVALGSCRLTGFEALVRWNHPKRGVIGPVEFIALAEETGLIVSIGQFVLRDACSQMAAWHRRFPDAQDVSISINLSGHQLSSPTLVTDILQVLEDTGLDPKCVKLELTESTLIDDPTTATRILGRLRERGIQLYIDDFGTGYSSLSYLHRFAIDGLKIDKSFVDMVGHDDRKAAIVPSIVGLAHNLGMGVVAEGVETIQQARELTLLDCAEAQGYLYSRPVPRDEAAKLIVRRILG